MQKALAEWNTSKSTYALYVLIALYLLLFLPFWKPVLLGLLFAAACAPLVNKIRARLQAKRTRVAYATVSLGLAVFLTLIVVVALQIYSRIYEVVQNQEAMGTFNDKIAGFRDQILAWTSRQDFLASINVREQLDRAVVALTGATKSLAINVGQAFAAGAPMMVLQLFIFVLAYGAFLVMLPRLWRAICQALQLGPRAAEHFSRFEHICSLALGSILITGAIQSVIATLGAAIAGYDAYVLIFGATFICAMIPVIGAGAVPTVLALVSLMQGETSGAVIMIVTAAITGISDNVIRAYLFSRAAESNPAISIITLLGGLALMGFPGLFVAPVLEQLVMTYAFSEEGEPKPHQISAHEDDKSKPPPRGLDTSGLPSPI